MASCAGVLVGALGCYAAAVYGLRAARQHSERGAERAAELLTV